MDGGGGGEQRKTFSGLVIETNGKAKEKENVEIPFRCSPWQHSPNADSAITIYFNKLGSFTSGSKVFVAAAPIVINSVDVRRDFLHDSPLCLRQHHISSWGGT